MTPLQPRRLPIATCAASTCADCALSGRVHCHFRVRDFVSFMAIALPSLFLAAWAIARFRSVFLYAWVALCILFFGLVETRVLCSHCPHYAEPSPLLRCWANWGTPKLWRNRSGALSGLERAILYAGFAAVWGSPLPFVHVSFGWQGLLVYAIATGGFFAVLRWAFCSRCINVHCPMNRVPAVIRERFLLLNPRA